MKDSKNNPLLDEYEIKADLIPAIITSPPFLLLHLFFLNPLLNNLFGVFSLISQYFTGISLPFIFIFSSMQLNRMIGKIIFEKIIFKNRLNFPTTNYLLYSNKEVSSVYKNKLRKKIFIDFKIKFPNKKNEIKNLNETRIIINDVVGLIREKIKSGRLLFIYNTQYGFFRNLIGGALIGIIISLTNILIGIFKNNETFLIYSITCLAIFLFPIVISKFIINELGKLYADRLFSEYLSS